MKEAERKYLGYYFMTVLFGAVAAFFMSRFSLCLGNVIDVISKSDDTLGKCLLSCVIMLVLWLVFTFFFDYAEIVYVNKTIRYIKSRLYHALYQKELSDFMEQSNGSYLGLFSKDMDLLVDNYLVPKCDIASNFLSATVCLVSIFMIHWKLGLIFVGISFVTIVLSQLPGAVMAKKTSAYSTSTSRYLGILENYLGGYEQVKLLGLNKRFCRKLDEKDAVYEKSRKNYLFAKIAAMDLGMSFGMLSQLFCMAAGIWLVLQKDLTVGLLIAAVQLLNGVFSPLQNLVNDKNLMGTVDDILHKIDVNQMMEEEQRLGLEEKIRQVEFKDISLQFGDKKIFDHYHVQFEQGKKYAILGESGKGKSTLAKLLMKYVKDDAYFGNVYINGQDIRTICSESIYQKIAFIQRNEFLVDGNVKDNILLYRTDAYEERLNGVCDALKLDETLKKKQIDISNKSEVSFGEKQRIDTARFMIGDYDMLIFDEPTSNLDPDTSEAIYNMIFAIKDKIVIVITHDTSEEYLNRFDEVIKLA